MAVNPLKAPLSGVVLSMRWSGVFALMIAFLVVVLGVQISASEPIGIITSGNLLPQYEHSPLTLVSCESNEMVVSVTPPTPSLTKVSAGGAEYSLISIPGWNFTSLPGFPKMPATTSLIAIPRSKQVSLDLFVRDSTIVEDCLVYPCEKIVTEITSEGMLSDKAVFEINEAAYSSEVAYPAAPVELAEVFSLRGQNVVCLNICPMRYILSKRTLILYTSIDVRLAFDSPVGPQSVPAGPYDRVAGRWLLGYHLTDNAPAYAPLSEPPDGSVAWCHSVQECAVHQTDYVIIAADRFFAEGDSTSAVFRLAEHRASFTGFNVAIVDVDDLGLGIQSTPDTLLKAFVDSLYRSQTAEHMSDGHLGYSLLLGGFKDANGDTLVPVHWVGSRSTVEPDYPSDNWFAALFDTFDTSQVEYYSHPELALPQIEIGRLAVIDSTELESVVDKIVNGEPLTSGSAWTDRVFLTSAYNVLTQAEKDTLQSTFSQITEIAQAAGYDTLLFRGDWKPKSYDFISENCRVINSGAHFVHYGIHGEACRMGAPASFSAGSLTCFTNSDSLAVFFTGACKTASFDNLCVVGGDTSACIGAALVNYPNGGAVAFLGPAPAAHISTPILRLLRLTSTVPGYLRKQMTSSTTPATTYGTITRRGQAF